MNRYMLCNRMYFNDLSAAMLQVQENTMYCFEFHPMISITCLCIHVVNTFERILVKIYMGRTMVIKYCISDLRHARSVHIGKNHYDSGVQICPTHLDTDADVVDRVWCDDARSVLRAEQHVWGPVQLPPCAERLLAHAGSNILTQHTGQPPLSVT